MHDFVEYLCDSLGPLGKISSRKMFGEHCLFLNGQMFAIIDKDHQIFIKTSQISGIDTPFTYQRQGKSVAMNYVKIDDGLIDDIDELMAVIAAKLKF